MDKKDAQKIAEPVVKRVVDLIAERKYEEIPQVAELTDWSEIGRASCRERV